MYNQEKIKLFQKLLVSVVVVISGVVGFAIGNIGKEVKTSQAKQAKTVEVKKEEGLSTQDVQGFLLAYYTKKDLSENRSRYQPLMTQTMFNQEVAKEELPVNQAYKGYTINQVFDHATVYIDKENNVAIAEVNYHNTQLKEKNNFEGALSDTPIKETVQLTFVKNDKKYLVNNIAHVFLTSSNGDTQGNQYPINKGEENG